MKNVRLTDKNHEYLRNKAFYKNSNIQKESNKIIAEMRLREGIKKNE
jgi:hypothetical protein